MVTLCLKCGIATLCLDRATGNVWGHTNPDVGEVYPPVPTTTGVCYRTSTRVYGLQGV